jgi:proline dehydrogenase
MEKEKCSCREKYPSPICARLKKLMKKIMMQCVLYDRAFRYDVYFAGTHNELSTYTLMELMHNTGIKTSDDRYGLVNCMV